MKRRERKAFNLFSCAVIFALALVILAHLIHLPFIDESLVAFERDHPIALGSGLICIGGWTLLTAVNLMLFSLIHNPCSTTIYTIYKETGSRKWTAVAALVPLAMGFLVTFVVAQVWRLFAG